MSSVYVVEFHIHKVGRVQDEQQCTRAPAPTPLGVHHRPYRENPALEIVLYIFHILGGKSRCLLIIMVCEMLSKEMNAVALLFLISLVT